jgi:hypothetical protein
VNRESAFFSAQQQNAGGENRVSFREDDYVTAARAVSGKRKKTGDLSAAGSCFRV